MDLETALDWASSRTQAALITIRGNGRPQSSDISYSLGDGVIRISVTADRAKTRNLVRDPRAVVHVSERGSWSYISFEGDVELAPVTTDPADATADELVEVYRAIAGSDHSDWAEYRQAMIDEGRLVIRFTPTKASGQIN
jgi:PPOX class probable F420-dependent enzyme